MRVLVIGQSKTGTTALLWSAARALGFTEHVFEPASLEEVDLSPDDLIVKRLIDDYRWSESATLRRFDATLLIHRDPRDRYISWLLYDLYGREAIFDDQKVAGWLELLRKKEDDPSSVSVTTLNHRYWQLTGINLLFALGKTNEALIGFVLRHERDIVRVSYERFIEGEILQVNEALGLDAIGDRTVEGPEARVARTKSSGSWRRWFTPDDLEVFEPFCAPVLGEFGYEDDWSLDPDPRIPPAESSGYVQRLRATRLDEVAAAASPPSMDDAHAG